MAREAIEKLNRFREEAAARDIPSVDVERWLGTARRRATLSPRSNGPVVGRLGGPLMLPPDVPDPEFPLFASLDLATLPQDATNLPLPPDGRLLLFGCFEAGAWGSECPLGAALYIPAGTTVEERWLDFSDLGDPGSYEDVAELQGALHLRYDISLPDDDDIIDAAKHPCAAQLREVWAEVGGEGADDLSHTLHIGGYASDYSGEFDPVTSSARQAEHWTEKGQLPRSAEPTRPEDWVLLAELHADIPGWEDAIFYWSISRQDAAARRFDRTYGYVFFCP
ncbi:hypothetical protein [Micromonospora sp. NPDC023737]|uniref:DUF1963 domain-containing protein n=1 Tax=unclassified Micromonospora TaxID=2617518 RepID=UPI0033FE4B2D